MGSRRGLEASILPREGYALETVAAVSLKGKSLWGKMRSLTAIPASLVSSGRLIRSFRPQIVVGVGGYASGPVVLAAWVLGCKTAIHEQNAFPGLSNRILGRFADRTFISFAASARFFPPEKTVLTGNPVRRKLQAGAAGGGPCTGGPFTLLVFGGSQGAHRLNQAMADALPHLREIKGRLHILHQTGEKDWQEIREAYQREGFAAEVQPFFHEMEKAYAAADLVLCRAGATTLFELMALGKAAILVPYPYAANDHQTLNAQALADAGAALRQADGQLNGAELSRLLKELISDPGRLAAMRKSAAALGKPEAAQNIVNLCYELVAHG